MDALWIITVFDLADELMRLLGHRSHCLADVPDSEVITVAIVAAKYFQNHHERTLCQRTLCLMQQLGYLSGPLSVSRFNRRLHRLAPWLQFIIETLGEVFSQGEVFIIDSLPIPTCRRARARRCRKVQGCDFCGYCAAKKEKFVFVRDSMQTAQLTYTTIGAKCARQRRWGTSLEWATPGAVGHCSPRGYLPAAA